jgi:DNA-binding IscR family transcriptional regulator
MKAKREFRDRDEVAVAVLDALVERGEEGMTVFELRSSVDHSIDDIEEALTALKADGLIDVDRGGGGTRLKPDPRVVPEEPEDDENGFFEALLERLPF